jgi:hypothetical protein
LFGVLVRIQEGEVYAGELLESREGVRCCGMHFCGQGAVVDVGEE